MTRNDIEKYYRFKAMSDEFRPIRVAICERMGMRPGDWMGGSKQRDIVRIRRSIAWIAREKA